MFTNIYSPLEQLKHPSRVNISVKRDDLIDLYISGNKWRKLKYILKEAERLEKRHLITFGGAYSNHLIATAAACSKKGIKSSAFVRGEYVENEVLMLCKLYGMDLIFTSRDEYKNKTLLFDTHFGNHHDAFFVDEGGSGEEALKGCSEIISELPADTDHLFCAAGTGTTGAGLLKGIHKAGLKTILHVVPVLKGDFIADAIFKYTGNNEQLQIHNEYHFGGYAKTQPSLIAYIKKFVAEEGMLIDPVYTAKMFYAIDDLLGKNYFSKKDKIVALHTGGLLGIMGMRDKLNN